jgi:hypothetical protein
MLSLNARQESIRDIIFTGSGIAWDEAGIQQAAEEGGIRNVYYADYKITTVLGVFGMYTTIVYGD